nr:PREDICTED: probable E3 ubiquitin-protein ligase RNF217 [Raphanus sativus]
MGSCLSSSSSILPRTRTVGYSHRPRNFPPYKVSYIVRPTRTKQQQEPAKPSTKLCMICMDERSSSDIFRGTTSCTHSYCTECTIRYVATKVEENAARVKCPDINCTQLIEPYACRDLIPKDLFVRWDKAICESLIMSSEKVYCPFENCSAVMVVDDDDDGVKVTQTECPSCHRLFCAQCEVPWHAGRVCKDMKKKKKNSDKEDALLIDLAKQKKWRRCPKCKFYVEKSSGCLHIICRCGFHFCYLCGSSSSGIFHSCGVARTSRP